ncbi:MAG TPA: DinB family protein [Thermoanaerobaculia bacterium]|nr:DinB family protein [Thermoanaerobaculia bacterium]
MSLAEVRGLYAYTDWANDRIVAAEPFTNRFLDVLFHVVNHSNYHRGQLITMLRQVGAIPPGTDLIVYRRESPPGP